MAKKKKAPAIKSNLRDVPADKFRAVNRMNGIVTMVEYTSEDDIKAYELEPTFRELGGGVGVDIDNPTLTINYHQNGYTSPIPFSRVFQIGESVGYIALQENHLTLNPMLVGEDGTISLYMTSSDTEIMFNPLTTNENATETINCEFAGEGEDHAIIVTDTQENAIISISYTPGGVS